MRRHLFVIDPLGSLLPDADSTIAFMREASSRGEEVWSTEIGELVVGEDAGPRATVRRVVTLEGDPWFRVDDKHEKRLDAFDVVWMRKDPPFDASFYFATLILSMVAPPTLVVNDPGSLRDANEKLFALRFPELCPPSLVARDVTALQAFRARHGGEMVVKPIDGAGGTGVFHIRPDDRNAAAILEMSSAGGTRYLLAQRYLPAIREGDKRVIVVEGEPLGAVMRVPRDDEARANFHAGGRAEKAAIDDADRAICARIAPTLRRMGIVFAGIDVIGGKLIEINVTSPTGLREIAALDGRRLEVDVLDAVAARVERRRKGEDRSPATA